MVTPKSNLLSDDPVASLQTLQDMVTPSTLHAHLAVVWTWRGEGDLCNTVSVEMVFYK